MAQCNATEPIDPSRFGGQLLLPCKMRYMQDFRRPRASTTSLPQEDREDSVNGDSFLGQAQECPGCSKLVSIAVGDFTLPGRRLSPLPRDRKRVFFSKSLSPPVHGSRHPWRAISRTSIVWFVLQYGIALGILQGPRSSCSGTCVVWPESGMERGMGCIKFETALRIHFRKDQAPPP